MIRTIARLAVRRTRLVLLLTAVAVPVLAVAGGGVKERLSVGGFVDPSASSTVAAEHLETVFGTASPNYVFVAAATTGLASDPANAAAGRVLVAELAAEHGVADVVSPWTLGDLPADARNPLYSRTGDKAVLALRLAGDEDAQRAAADRLAAYAGDRGAFVLTPTGPAEVSREAAEQAEKDLLRAELIAAPLTLVGLLAVFRGWRAASIPLAIAVLAVLGTFTVLTLLTTVTTVSVFALNLTTALGLGLAVDYSLVLVARFREERAAGWDVPTAVERTVHTAGRTVAFSAATVALSMLALLVFPVAYLRSFALAGVAVVATAGAAAIVVVPALLARFGAHIGVERASAHRDGGFWARQARRVMRHPVLWVLAVGAVLVAAGLPFAGVEPGRIDDRVLPAATDARTGADLLRKEFYLVDFNPISVVTPWIDPADTAAVTAFETQLLGLPNVYRVDSVNGFVGAGLTVPATAYNERFRVSGPAGAAAGTWFDVTTWKDPDTPEAEELVARIRALDPRVQVTGTTAVVVDTVDAVLARIPLALAIVAATTLVLLFLMTGSVLVPVKAVVLNLLSLTATFGALVWIFQDGHLAGLLDVTATGRIDVFTPILMFCVAFGLSMDYEVFLLARIKESYDLHDDGVGSVAEGLGHTGRLVTAAALLLAVVFLAIATSGVTIVKMFGLGLALAVVVDAFLVRATLVPALMRLAGRANWWAPGPLRRFHLRWGVWEGQPLDLRFETPAGVPAPLAPTVTDPTIDPAPTATTTTISTRNRRP